MIYSYDTVKIPYKDCDELAERLNHLNATKIMSVKPCAPSQTDTRQWVSVYYEFVVNKENNPFSLGK